MTQKPLRRKFLHTASFYTQQAYTKKPLHRKAFTHRSFHTQHVLHTARSTHCKLLHTANLHREAFAQRSFTDSKLLHKESCSTVKFLHREVFYTHKALTQRSFLVHNGIRNCRSKTGSRHQTKKKKHDFEALFKRNSKRKISSAKMNKNLLTNHHRNLHASFCWKNPSRTKGVSLVKN